MRALRARSARLLVAAVAVGVLATACGSEVDAASIGDASMSRGELDEILDDRIPEDADGNHSTEQSAGVLNDFIFFEAVAAELEIEPTDADLDAAAAQLDQQAQLEGQEFDPESPDGVFRTRIEAINAAAATVVDGQIAAFDVSTVEVICSSHILLVSEADAEAAIARLESGEAFAEVAMELSTGPSGPGGGDLGCVATSGLVAEFVEGAREVEPAGVTGPVETQFGFHVIELRSIGPLTTDVHPELDDASIVTLEAQVAQSVPNLVVNEITTAALDRIDDDLELDSRYGEWDRGQGGVVVPDGVTTESVPLPESFES